MSTWFENHPITSVALIIAALFGFIALLLWAADRSVADQPHTQGGTAVQSADMGDGVTCYVVHSTSGVAISCLRRLR